MIMVLKVNVNGIWKEVGKDITWEEYEEYCENRKKKYEDFISKKLGVDKFHFNVLDCARGELDTLILRFPTSESIDDFINEYDVSDFIVSVKVLDKSIGLVKVVLDW